MEPGARRRGISRPAVPADDGRDRAARGEAALDAAADGIDVTLFAAAVQPDGRIRFETS